MEVVIEDNGDETLGGILDSRDEKEGIYYDISNSDLVRKKLFNDRKKFIDKEFDRRCEDRKELLGFGIEPTETMRKISIYSNPDDDRLDYRKEYVFHHWLTKKKALIEDVDGSLLEVVYKNNFRFIN